MGGKGGAKGIRAKKKTEEKKIKPKDSIFRGGMGRGGIDWFPKPREKGRGISLFEVDAV